MIRLLSPGNIFHGRTDAQICFYCLKLGEVSTRFRFKLNDMTHSHICHDCTLDILRNTLTRPNRSYYGSGVVQELYCDRCNAEHSREDWLEWGGRGGLCLKHTQFHPVNYNWTCKNCCHGCVNQEKLRKQGNTVDEIIEPISDLVLDRRESDVMEPIDAIADHPENSIG